MQNFSLFDIIGPQDGRPFQLAHSGRGKAWAHGLEDRVRGRESGRAYAVWLVCDDRRGHGTDKALVAGILGLAPDDARLRYSLLLAQEAGVSVDIRYSDEEPGASEHRAHPHNECRRQGNGDRGRVHRRREHPHHRDQRHGS